MRRMVWAVLAVAGLWACGGGAAEQVEPVGMEVAGRLYQQKCSLCHGADGKLMASGAPDLTASRMDYADRERIIRYGKGLMPPQGNVLTSEEIAGVARFLDTFRAAE